MSRGLGKVERAVLEFVRVHRRPPDVDGVVAVEQSWMAGQLSEKWQKPAIRRAVITLVAKGLLHKFTGLYDVFVDIEPVTHKRERSLSGNSYYRVEVKPRRTLPDFEALITAELATGPEAQAWLARKILLNSEGCWRNLRGRYGSPYPALDGASRLAFYRAVNRMVEAGKIKTYRKANKRGRPGDVWLSLTNEL